MRKDRPALAQRSELGLEGFVLGCASRVEFAQNLEHDLRSRHPREAVRRAALALDPHTAEAATAEVAHFATPKNTLPETRPFDPRTRLGAVIAMAIAVSDGQSLRW